jgi:hypothetical protein
MRLGSLAHFLTNRSSLGIGILMIEKLGDTKQLIHLLKRHTYNTVSKAHPFNRKDRNPPLVSGIKNQTKTNIEKQKQAKIKYVLQLISKATNQSNPTKLTHNH